MRTIVSLLVFFCVVGVNSAQEAIGIWQGKLSVGSISLRLVFHISLGSDSLYKAQFDSPDQGVKSIAFDEATFENRQLTLRSNALRAVFRGTVGMDSLVGTWSQGGQSLPLSLIRTLSVVQPKRPQSPKPPYPYDTLDVVFENKQAKTTLAGTITRPKGIKKSPAILLVSGSGPQNRDEEILGHRTFAVLADFLSKQGFAVLRYDDRGVGKSTGDFSKATTRDFADDAKTGIEFLRRQQYIRADAVGLLGHSEGGAIAAMLSAESNLLNFSVMLAGPALSGADILGRQNRDILIANGVDTALAMWYERYLRSEVYPLAVAATNPEQTQANLSEAVNRMFLTFGKEEQDMLGLNPTARQAMVQQLSLPWTRAFLRYDPRPDLKKSTTPLLALYGKKDLQVSASENAAALREALPSAEIVEIDGVNHLFQTCTTGMPMEYGIIEETIAPAMLEILGKWLNKHVKK